VRSVRLDLRPTDLIDPYSAITGAKPELRESEHLFFRLSAPEVVAYLKRWTRAPAPGQTLQPEVFNKVQEWLGSDGDQLGDWDISRDAPYFGIEIPTSPRAHRRSTSTCGSTRRSAISPRSRSTSTRAPPARSGAARIRRFHGRSRRRAIPLHRQGHRLLPHAVLAGDAAFSDRKTPTNVFVHGFMTLIGEKMSKSRGSGISPQRYAELGLDPEWLRYYLAAKLNAKSRTSTSIRTTSSRASTAT
jgi:methionyl-tRNA synthetase